MSAYDYTHWVCDRCNALEEVPQGNAPRPDGWTADPNEANCDLCEDCVDVLGGPTQEGAP